MRGRGHFKKAFLRLLFSALLTFSTNSFAQSPAGLDPRWLYEVAKVLVGIPYKWGGNGQGGFDCSGLVVYVYKHLGIKLPRTSREQFRYATPTKFLLPGDLLFFSSSRSEIDHVGIYLYPDPKTGKPLFLHASGKWGQVVVEPLENYRDIFVGAGRVIRNRASN